MHGETEEPRGRPDRRPGRQKVSDGEIEAWMEEGLGPTDMSHRLADRGIDMSVAGLSLRRKAILERRAEQGNFLLPWIVASEHASHWVYSAVLCYAKMRAGRGLSKKERKLALEFEAEMVRLGNLVTYDREAGFLLRPRRASDGPSLLVEE